MKIKLYGRAPIYLRILRKFQKSKIYDPYEVMAQAKNVLKKGYMTNSETTWTPQRLQSYREINVEVIR